MPTYKLTQDLAYQIREEHASGVSQRVLCERYGIQRSGMSKLINGKTWNDKRIPVEPLQRAVRRSGMTPYDIARELGWMRRHRDYLRPDDGRVSRDLGLRDDESRGYRYRARYIDRLKAQRICDIIGAAPVDVGL